MTEITFEWDEKKNKLNKKIHGISFDDARFVFSDPLKISCQIFIIVKKKSGGLQ